MIKYTDEIKQYIIDNYKEITNTELARKCSKKFNLDFTEDSIANFKSRLYKSYGINLRNAINAGCFKKGSIPFNKGTKGLMKSNKTSFKKGNVPANYKSIGAERVSKDDYIEIKIRDGECSTGKKNYVLKHRYLYEQYYGKIPKGSIVIFADGNKRNFDKSNLIAISKNQNVRLNQNKLRFSNKELTEAGINLANFIIKTNEVKNARK